MKTVTYVSFAFISKDAEIAPDAAKECLQKWAEEVAVMCNAVSPVFRTHLGELHSLAYHIPDKDDHVSVI